MDFDSLLDNGDNKSEKSKNKEATFKVNVGGGLASLIKNNNRTKKNAVISIGDDDEIEDPSEKNKEDKERLSSIGSDLLMEDKDPGRTKKVKSKENFFDSENEEGNLNFKKRESKDGLDIRGENNLQSLGDDDDFQMKFEGTLNKGNQPNKGDSFIKFDDSIMVNTGDKLNKGDSFFESTVREPEKKETKGNKINSSQASVQINPNNFSYSSSMLQESPTKPPQIKANIPATNISTTNIKLQPSAKIQIEEPSIKTNIINQINPSPVKENININIKENISKDIQPIQQNQSIQIAQPSVNQQVSSNHPLFMGGKKEQPVKVTKLSTGDNFGFDIDKNGSNRKIPYQLNESKISNKKGNIGNSLHSSKNINPSSYLYNKISNSPRKKMRISSEYDLNYSESNEPITQMEMDLLQKQIQESQKLTQIALSLQKQITQLSNSYKNETDTLKRWHNNEIENIKENNKKTEDQLKEQIKQIQFENEKENKKQKEELEEQHKREIENLKEEHLEELNDLKQQREAEEYDQKQLTDMIDQYNVYIQDIEQVAKNLNKEKLKSESKDRIEMQQIEEDIMRWEFTNNQRESNLQYKEDSLRIKEEQIFLKEKQFEKYIFEQQQKMRQEMEELNKQKKELEELQFENKDKYELNAFQNQKDKNEEMEDLIKKIKDSQSQQEQLKFELITIEKEINYFEKYKIEEFKKLDYLKENAEKKKLNNQIEYNEILRKNGIAEEQEKIIDEEYNQNNIFIQSLNQKMNNLDEREQKLFETKQKIKILKEQISSQQNNLAKEKDNVTILSNQLNDDLVQFNLMKSTQNIQKEEIQSKIDTLERIRNEHIKNETDQYITKANWLTLNNTPKDLSPFQSKPGTYRAFPNKTINYEESKNNTPSYTRTLISADDYFSNLKKRLENTGSNTLIPNKENKEPERDNSKLIDEDEY
ncbi:MAG: hypothetical protein MJ252_02730 [archaeon]|nr:hypothetical protein [archaeon]